MPKIAISYRGSDSQDITGQICDRLSHSFGAVFRDTDNIRPGVDFRVQIADALQTTDVLLLVSLHNDYDYLIWGLRRAAGSG